MSEGFLHGVEVVEVNGGLRQIRTASTSVIGIVGTAPRADATAFPLNKPVLVANSRTAAAALLKNAAGEDGDGTLPEAIDSILDQAGAAIVVVRVEKESTDAATLANVLGGVNATTGQYEGVHALIAAESELGVKPRILIAPGFTHQRTAGAVRSLTISAAGSGYTNGTYTLTASGGGGSGAAASAVVSGQAVTSVTITSAGSGYTSAPTFALPGTAGEGSGATFAATIGDVTNAVVAELLGIADRLRAVIVMDGPSTTDAAAVAAAGDFGSRRVYLVDPRVMKVDSEGAPVAAHSSAAVAGIIARNDNAPGRGYWWSPSNQEIYGITGTERPIDFSLGDPTSRANLLNAANVATIIRQNGFRLWGNRTLSSDPKWKFLSVVRTADIIADALQAAHLWAVDNPVAKNYVTDVQEGVNAFLRDLKARGAILGGECWIDLELNTPSAITSGNVFWDFDFTPPYPAERLTFRSHLVDNYISEIF